MKFYITKHAIIRFTERFNPKMLNLIKKSFTNPSKNNQKNIFLIEKEMRFFLNDGKIDNSYKNDTEKLMYFYERYGFDVNYQFIKYGKIVFVCRIEKKKHVVVTCYNDLKEPIRR